LIELGKFTGEFAPIEQNREIDKYFLGFKGHTALQPLRGFISSALKIRKIAQKKIVSFLKNSIIG